MQKRCICGYAKSFPICDGAHQGRGWSCAQQEDTYTENVVISSFHYRSLAQKWAYHLRGSIFEDRAITQCDHLWILCDGSNLSYITQQMNMIQAQKTTLVAINISFEHLHMMSDVDEVRIIDDRKKIPIWTQLQLEGVPHKKRTRQKIFLSHSVADEAILGSIVSFLRKGLQHEVFDCSDSILAGSLWYTEITKALKESDIMLCMLSSSFAQSTFCAFEVGMARALDKEIRIISIDDTLPPSYAQDIQMISVPRYQRAHPWLSIEETLLECILLS